MLRNFTFMLMFGNSFVGYVQMFNLIGNAGHAIPDKSYLLGVTTIPFTYTG